MNRNHVNGNKVFTNSYVKYYLATGRRPEGCTPAFIISLVCQIPINP